MLRAAGVFGLAGVAVIHFSQVVQTIEQTPWLGAAFVLLSLVCIALANQLLQPTNGRLSAAIATVNALTVVG